LRDVCSGVLIIAHHEDTTLLRTTFESEGLAVEEVRGPYASEHAYFSAIMRCMVNHANAWRIAATRDRPTVIVEADFVPVRGFGGLQAPLPENGVERFLCYLYAVGPQVWELVRPDLARGHGGGMVALLMPPAVATLLLEFYEEELGANPRGEYSPFDSKVGYWLMKHGVESYIPYRHYGEHGGIGNPEHAAAGLGRAHRADALQGKLAFLPDYSAGSHVKFWTSRMRARVWGVLRLLSGRYLAWRDFKQSSKLQMLRYGVGRLFFQRRPRG
jgi:hypothetical protein